MKKIFYITNGSLHISPFFSMRRVINIYDDVKLSSLTIHSNHASWRSSYLNTDSGKYPRKSEKPKIIVLENVTYQSEKVVDCNFAQIDYVETWIKARLKSFYWEIKGNEENLGHLQTMKTIKEIENKIQNFFDITLDEIHELDRIVENIKLYNKRIQEMYRNFQSRQSINLMEFMGAWELVNECIQEGKIMFTEGRVVYIDKSLPEEMINFLQNAAYKVMKTGKIDVVNKTSDLIQEGLIRIIGFIAQVSDRVDIDVIDYLKNEMFLIIETM